MPTAIQRKNVQLSGHPNEVNAFRRSLISKLKTIAPSYITIQKNTTALTDEFIAQRIGMIPFDQDHMEPAELHVVGRYAKASDFKGHACPFEDIIVAHVDDDQELHLTVEFTEGIGSDHARFSKTCGVGMSTDQQNLSCSVSFETIFQNTHRECAQEALQYIRSQLMDLRNRLTEESLVNVT